MNIFAVRFKELREENKLSQKEIAKILNVSQSAVAKWELAKTEPTASAIIISTKTFKVTTDYLLGLEDDLGNKIYNDFRFNQGTINNKF